MFMRKVLLMFIVNRRGKGDVNDIVFNMRYDSSIKIFSVLFCPLRANENEMLAENRKTDDSKLQSKVT